MWFKTRPQWSILRKQHCYPVWQGPDWSLGRGQEVIQSRSICWISLITLINWIRLRCEWYNDYEKGVTKPPIVVSDLEVVELNFRGKPLSMSVIVCLHFCLRLQVIMWIAGWKFSRARVPGLHQSLESFLLEQHWQWWLASTTKKVGLNFPAKISTKFTRWISLYLTTTERRNADFSVCPRFFRKRLDVHTCFQKKSYCKLIVDRFLPAS